MIAGEDQSPEVHAVVHYINQVLGNNGATVTFTPSLEGKPADQWADLQALVQDLRSGQVDLLLILGGNPVYSAPLGIESQGRDPDGEAPDSSRRPTRRNVRSLPVEYSDGASFRALERRPGLRRHRLDHAAADCTAL